MKDLTHYFNSPPQQEKSNENIKTPEDETYEDGIDEKVKKIKKRKKRKNKFNTVNDGSLEVEKNGVKRNYHDNVLQGTNFDFRKSCSPLNNQLLCLKNSLENSECIGDKLKLDENIDIEKKSHCDKSRIVCEKMDLSMDSNLSDSGIKHKRKRKKCFSETEPKKKVCRNLNKDKLKTVPNPENSVDISTLAKEDTSTLTDSELLTKRCENDDDSRENIIRKFVGIKLKVINSSSGSPNKYEINKSKRKNKKSSRINNKLDFVTENEMPKTDDVFKNEGKRSKHSKENKKHKYKRKKHDLTEDNNCASKSSKDKNAVISGGIGNELTESEESVVKCNKDNLTVSSNDSNDLEKPDSEKRNSLFKYYTKIDKATFQATKTNEKIKVKAVIHTPPFHKKKSLCISNDINEDLPKITKKKYLKRQILNEVDEITVLSSEIITILDEESCQSETELQNNTANSVVNVRPPSELVTPLKQGNPWKMRVSLSSSKSQLAAESDESIVSCLDENNSSGESNTLRRELCKGNITDSSAYVMKKISLHKCSDVENSAVNILDISDESDDRTKTTDESILEVIDNSKPKKANGSIINNVSKSASGKSCERKKTCGADLMAKFLGLSPKEISKPTIDLAVLKARQKFLESGVPDVIRQKIDNCQSDKILALPAPFPKISHVQQRNLHHIVWNLPAPSFNLHPSPCLDSLSFHPKWNLIMNKSIASLVSHNNTNCDSPPPLLPTVDVKHHVKKLKKNLINVLDVKEVWKSIQEMKDGCEPAFEVWPEVYKPRKDSDFISNCDNIQKLKSWMESFRNNRLDLQDSESSGAEFVDSDSEDRASSFSSTCIISGPNGCGKTCAVFAVANELGYKVFEVNASCNRNGKKVLTDLSEATQSHQVEHSKAISNFFTQGKVKDKEKKKRKKKRKENQQEQSSSKKRSLILIEDADLLFNDKDEGFIPSISTLAGSSKRPLILIVNDIKAPHLVKLFQVNQLKLNFHRPSAAKLESWLQLISLANGMKLEPYAAKKLVQWSECDVRKSLLQLQLLVQSNSKSELSWPGISDAPVWISAVSIDEKEQDLYKENLAKNKAIIREKLKSTIILAQSLVTYDLLSYSAVLPLERVTNPSPVPCKIKPAASTSLVDSTESLNENNLASDIADYLYGSVTTCTPSILRSQSQARKTEEALMSALPYYAHCSHDAVFVDYLPTLRLLGRAETVRLALHTKRTNRFFNYLNGLGVNASDSCIKYMCDTFS